MGVASTSNACIDLQAQRSGLRVAIVKLRILFLYLLQLVVESCSRSCKQKRPNVQFGFTVSDTCLYHTLVRGTDMG